MTYEEILQLMEKLRGVTLEEWKHIREEVDAHFGVKCMEIVLDKEDTAEIARLVALRLGTLTQSEAEAPRQIRLDM